LREIRLSRPPTGKRTTAVSPETTEIAAEGHSLSHSLSADQLEQLAAALVELAAVPMSDADRATTAQAIAKRIGGKPAGLITTLSLRGRTSEVLTGALLAPDIGHDLRQCRHRILPMNQKAIHAAHRIGCRNNYAASHGTAAALDT
jgi:hypothetical protein